LPLQLIEATPKSPHCCASTEQEWSYASQANPKPTFPAVQPKRKIDYIMYKPSDRWRVLESRVIDEKIASDHCPVLAVFELLPNR